MQVQPVMGFHFLHVGYLARVFKLGKVYDIDFTREV